MAAYISLNNGKSGAAIQMQLHHFKREDFAYQAAYCEENIWHLCQQSNFQSKIQSKTQSKIQNSYVVFIFSKGDAFPMLKQRASGDHGLPIFWDYHVVLLVMTENNQVLDFDTTLEFNTDIGSYFRESFVDESFLSDQEIPWFRLVPSDEFVRLFSSDRRHMKTATGWLSPPPSWPTIGDIGSNLAAFIQAEDNQFGELLTYDAMLSRFCDK